MTKQEKKASEAKSAVVADLPRACTDELAAVEFLEKQRWGDSPCCPHCGSVAVVKLLKDRSDERNARFLWYCRDCKKQYTVRVGTVFEDSRIDLRHWCYAFWAACASKKGVSAKQIQRQTQVSYKSALFLLHRIRFAMAAPNTGEKLTGTVEVDETYVGGKPRKGGYSKSGQKIVAKHGRGTRKTPVMVLVQRDGNARAQVVANVKGSTVKAIIKEQVDKSALINTDDWKSYRYLTYQWPGGHDVVNHSMGQYVHGSTYTNTAESFFALLKRGLHGTFHAVSKKHLHRYVDEFVFRWCARKMSDGERVTTAIRAAQGKRLMYKEPIQN